MAVYANLTNGLVCAPHGAKMLRIQSTHCEAKQWEEVLAAASDDLLYDLATTQWGSTTVVHDFSEKPRETRAMWQGLELIRCVAQWEWYGLAEPINGRGGAPMFNYFEEVYENLPRRVLSRYQYFRRYVSSPHGFGLMSCWRFSGCGGKWRLSHAPEYQWEEIHRYESLLGHRLHVSDSRSEPVVA